MKQIRHIAAFSLAALLAFAFTGCGGAEGGVAVPPGDPAHTHQYAEEWSRNATHHWHDPLCDDTEEPSDYGQHEWQGGRCRICGEPEDTREETALDVLCDELSSSYYRQNLKCTRDAGLSDASLVGVDKTKLENEERYAVPADASFARIYHAEDYNILPSNADNSNSLSALLRALNEETGSKKVVFPSGVYRFSKTLSFTDVSDLYLVGEGNVEISMTQWTVALRLTRTQNFHINNIDFDYDPSSTATGTVYSTDPAARTVTIAIDDEFDLSGSRFTGGKINKGNYMEYVYDEVAEAYIPDESGMLRYNSTGDSQEMIQDGSYDAQNNRLTLTFAQGTYIRPEIGKVVSVAFTMYENYTVEAQSCKDLYMENCNIYASVGMTFGLYSTENIYLNRTNVMLREGSKRLMTATADGLHTNDCFGELLVSNSIYEASHDDSMNICTFYKQVTDLVGSVITCKSSGSVTDFPVNVGDKIEVYNGGMEVMGSYTVQNVTKLGLTYELTVDQSVRGIKSAFEADGRAGWRVGNLTRTPHLVVENCLFRNKRNRGMLVQTQNFTITGCTFYNIIHSAIQILSAEDIFSEGLLPRNGTVENCKFVNNHATLGTDLGIFRYGNKIVANTITGMTVRNNFLASERIDYGVQLTGAGDCTVSHNLLYSAAASPRNFYLAVVDRSSDITLEYNYVYFKSGRSGYTLLAGSDAANALVRGNETNATPAG